MGQVGDMLAIPKQSGGTIGKLVATLGDLVATLGDLCASNGPTILGSAAVIVVIPGFKATTGGGRALGPRVGNT